MFDISFTEILVIAVVALVVLGPERLPRVARTLGHLLGRAQRYANDVKNDIQHEMELEELKKLKTSIQEASHTIENTVRSEINQFQELAAETKSSTASPPEPPPGIAGEAASSPDSPATSIKPSKPLIQSKPSADDATGTEIHHQ
jgi:sec-independent protein translocase protein TatB